MQNAEVRMQNEGSLGQGGGDWVARNPWRGGGLRREGRCVVGMVCLGIGDFRLRISDWGEGIGDWGLGICFNRLSQIPNPQ